MKQVIYQNNFWAMTGKAFLFEMDNDRGFYSTSDSGSLDAPNAMPEGSTYENVVNTGMNGESVRAIVPGVVFFRAA